jgi:hypothetical protein
MKIVGKPLKPLICGLLWFAVQKQQVEGSIPAAQIVAA